MAISVLEQNKKFWPKLCY